MSTGPKRSPETLGFVAYMSPEYVGKRSLRRGVVIVMAARLAFPEVQS